MGGIICTLERSVAGVISPARLVSEVADGSLCRATRNSRVVVDTETAGIAADLVVVSATCHCAVALGLLEGRGREVAAVIAFLALLDSEPRV